MPWPKVREFMLIGLSTFSMKGVKVMLRFLIVTILLALDGSDVRNF